mgnify:CR=1 FL=1
MDASIRGQQRPADETVVRRNAVRVAFNGRPLELECRESLDELAALKDAWQALERRCPEPFTYFQSFDWCINWSRTFLASGKEAGVGPKVYVLWDGAECVMIWPLMTRRVSPAISVLVPLTAPMNQYATLLYDPARFDPTLGRMVFDEIRNGGGPDAAVGPDGGL